MVFSSARADPARIMQVSMPAMIRAFIIVASSGLHVHVLDDVAQIAGGVPERLVALGLADAIEGAHHQTIGIGRSGRPHGRPLAERIAAEVGTELRAPPRGASVRRDLYLADSVSPVEGDPLDRDGLPHRHSRAGLGDS